jgi:putative phosphoesterase
VELVILADTHVPRRARDLPASVWDDVESADVVMHAGDWVDVALLDSMRARARRLVGVVGNNDGPALRERLPEVATVEVGAVRFTLVHETGASVGRERRMDALYAGTTDVLVFGHSHIPWDSTTPGGMRLLNPGSPTDRRRQPVGTYLRATVGANGLTGVTLVPVTPAP